MHNESLSICPTKATLVLKDVHKRAIHFAPRHIAAVTVNNKDGNLRSAATVLKTEGAPMHRWVPQGLVTVQPSGNVILLPPEHAAAYDTTTPLGMDEIERLKVELKFKTVPSSHIENARRMLLEANADDNLEDDDVVFRLCRPVARLAVFRFELRFNGLGAKVMPLAGVIFYDTVIKAGGMMTRDELLENWYYPDDPKAKAKDIWGKIAKMGRGEVMSMLEDEADAA